MPEINLVEIEFKNLLLGVLLFELERKEYLLNFALISSVLCKVSILCELLSYRRAALGNFLRDDVCISGTSKPAKVNAFVLIESIVFNGDESILKINGYLFNLDGYAVFR